MRQEILLLLKERRRIVSEEIRRQHCERRVLTADEAMLLQARWVEIVTSRVLPLEGGRKAVRR